MNTKDLSLDNLKLKVLIYGKSGTGKTTFSCTFPKPYVFDFDKGMLSQRGLDVEYDTYTTYPAFNTKLMELEKTCPYSTVIIDSITTLQDTMMKNICLLNKRARPTQHEWGLLIFDLMDLFTRITKLNVHIICTAHEFMVQNELTSEIIIQPLIYGKKLPGQLPLWFDEMYRAEVAKTMVNGVLQRNYQILTQASTMYTAKSRLNCLDDTEIPTYQAIMKKIKK